MAKFKHAEKNVLVYEVIHSNGETTLFHDMRLTRQSDGKWTAEIEIDGFTGMDSPHNAALKLGNWLERLSIAILKHDNYNVVDFSKAENLQD